jgi:hypothetical protein
MTALPRTRAYIQAVIDALHYDFSAFDIAGFLLHIENAWTRHLSVRYVPLSPELFGLWYPTEATDYIFINASLHPTHRIHSLLHEIAHMLLGHRGVNLQDVLGEELCQELGIRSGPGHLRSTWKQATNSTEEQEAEAFVMLVQLRVVHARRLHELYGETTSISTLQPYINGMDFNS